MINKDVSDEDTTLAMIGSRYDKTYGFYDGDVSYLRKFGPGLNAAIVRRISAAKNEPEWMLQQRLSAYETFKQLPVPSWVEDSVLSTLDLSRLCFYAQAADHVVESWSDVPLPIYDTFNQLNIPDTEKNYLNALNAQYDSTAIYSRISAELDRQGVIFVDTDTALQRYPEIVQQYFGSVVSAEDNKYAALNAAVWSGGTFIYVPEGVHVKLPLHAYYRLNTRGMGHFERTIIVVEKGSHVHFVEGCTAPVYKTASLHSGVVEIIAGEDSEFRLTAIQNWSSDVYNLATIRAVAHRNASIEFVDGNIGSCLTMKHPSIVLAGEGAHADVMSISFAGVGQYQDAGVQIIHAAPATNSHVVSKSISKDGGQAVYRGLLRIENGAKGAKSQVVCDSLLLDEHSRSDTYPVIEIREQDVQMGHEASVTQVGEEQLFYLMSRGLSESESRALLVNGFIDTFVKALPMTYALELNRLIRLQMIGSIG